VNVNRYSPGMKTDRRGKESWEEGGRKRSRGEK
jgi:hypothetical protein